MTERLAVLGSPIEHSKSPQLHLAAYRVLGLDWAYERIELGVDELEGFVSGAGAGYRGFSVTMPLKAELLRLSAETDAVARLTGAANTAIGMASGAISVFNTDVAGIVRALEVNGLQQARHAVLLGAGATAASALAALAELGVETVDLRLRDPKKAGALISLGRELGLMVLVDQLNPGLAEQRVESADVLLSTLPAHVVDPWVQEYAGIAPVVLDVAYEPWPSALATANAAGTVVSGLEMLLQQALIQVRIFVAGDPFAELPDEAGVLAAMRGALDAPRD